MWNLEHSLGFNMEWRSLQRQHWSVRCFVLAGTAPLAILSGFVPFAKWADLGVDPNQAIIIINVMTLFNLLLFAGMRLAYSAMRSGTSQHAIWLIGTQFGLCLAGTVTFVAPIIGSVFIAMLVTATCLADLLRVNQDHLPQWYLVARFWWTIAAASLLNLTFLFYWI